MRSIFLFITCLSLAAPSLSLIAGEQQPIEAVNSPVHTLASWKWENCAGLTTDAVQINSIQFSPDPPEPGKELTVTVKADVLKEIVDGAYADTAVKFGVVKLLEKKFDVCEEALKANGTIQCPVAPGSYTVVQTVTLPRDIPRAKYNVEVMGYTAEEEDMLCVRMVVDFRTW
ncbi:hypothetical protein CVT25_000971 [Psilocybe cyanescens]|uniref:Phosphatidylglycerol/phosphatidylinositol transfer protein n=1 Tax=Psilocybe cyanescens TaxID=93625 RepID=A0A409XME8_PSICY|nr:hypothetical protein CVT25_000971 [Psilocybe cyanescens]